MQFYRNRLPHRAQLLALGICLTAVVLISVQQINVGLGLWLLFMVTAVTYCTVQCAKRFSGLTHGNKILVLLIVLALGWKLLRMQGAIPLSIVLPIEGSDLTSALNSDVYLLWTYLSPIFSAFLLVIIILSPESQLTMMQIRDRRTRNKLWWQHRVSSTSKVLFYTTVLLLIVMTAWTLFDQGAANSGSVYWASTLLIFLPDMLLHLLGLLLYVELLAGNSAELKAASGSA